MHKTTVILTETLLSKDHLKVLSYSQEDCIVQHDLIFISSRFIQCLPVIKDALS